ncbi:outer membrane protein assembly factor BamE [Sneathiella sp. CAU 1612]|uniref:Outer membrane protein assembly factor BamE n=1 Tax=Sneathiella sedimenti TaxID=2816034 RepID=A0ABS3F7D2_9PROT|nr:outer membrane protein assembly factor BamE [Sneathiella sedimenti]MBO0334432.1 outer membrane protein assembly factor BamE [Sneathiella sedimenti]
MKLLKTGLSIAVLGLALTACEPIKTNQGYRLDPEQLAQIEAGVTNKDTVQAIMGSPSSIATFQTEGDAWYYISSKTEHLAFLAKEVTERDIVIVKFDINDVVAEVKDLSKEDGREIEIVERETPTGGRKLGLLEQLFGNLGRFNSAAQDN